MEIWLLLAVTAIAATLLIVNLVALRRPGAAAEVSQLKAANEELRTAQAVLSERLATTQKELTETQETLTEERTAHTATQQRLTETSVRAAADREQAETRLTELKQLRAQLQDAVGKLAADALRANNQAFLDLAKTHFAEVQTAAQGDLAKREAAVKELVQPLRQSLGQVDAKVQALETAREGAYAALRTQVAALAEGQQKLSSETAALVEALRRPQVRGKWGELQLQRTVEYAGMLEQVDFVQQQSVTTDEEARLRPDLLVHLPNGRTLVVDAKAPMEAYLNALQAADAETQRAEMARHARHIRDHAKALSAKNYTRQFASAPEFVVLFVPGEAMFSAALEADPALVEFATRQNVVLASPTTLIALLRAVAHGWQQAQLAEEAQKISQLGQELYQRLGKMGKAFADLGKSLDRSVAHYNKTVASLEGRVLVTGRKMAALVPATDAAELPEMPTIEQSTRPLRSEELQAPPEA